ncbi:MAG: hypothetical protein NVSMB39_6220 [Candidatus Saccharimonadales bacterium]
MRKRKHWSHDGKILRIFNVYSCIHEDEIYIGESGECLTKAMPHDRAGMAKAKKVFCIFRSMNIQRIYYLLKGF